MKNYFAWIRQQPCCLCSQGQWDMEKGQWRNSVSHVKTKGSGGKDEGNVLPMCLRFCHQEFEKLSAATKRNYLPLAKIYWENFLESNSTSH